MEKPIYQLQHYAPADYPMIEEWWHDHGATPAPEVILPKLGVIVQEFGDGAPAPVAALYLYLDNSTGVCFLEHIVTRPGLSVKRARNSLLWGMRCLRMLAADMDYGVMFCHTLPPIARTLKREGWQTMAKDKVSMVILTKEEKNGDRS